MILATTRRIVRLVEDLKDFESTSNKLVTIHCRYSTDGTWSNFNFEINQPNMSSFNEHGITSYDEPLPLSTFSAVSFQPFISAVPRELSFSLPLVRDLNVRHDFKSLEIRALSFIVISYYRANRILNAKKECLCGCEKSLWQQIIIDYRGYKRRCIQTELFK